MNAATATLGVANNALNITKTSLGALAQAASVALGLGGNLLVINEASFQFYLSPQTNSNNIQMNLNVTVLGTQRNYQVAYDFTNVSVTAKRIADKIIDDIKNI